MEQTQLARLSLPPCARSVRYIRYRASYVLKMHSGASLELPRRLIPYVRNASEWNVAYVELQASGSILRWEDIGIEHSVRALVREILGFNDAPRRGGATKSKARADASRANGKLGGRPRKKGSNL